LVRAPGPEASIHWFFDRKLEALAGLKPVLLDLAGRRPGVRVLEGHFMSVQQALGVPKGRQRAAMFVREFLEELRASRLAARVIEKNGVHGVTAV
jgi:polar amino acid transport system substrate-binding protein